MIYLLQDCYKDDKGNYHDILKIGYSKDSFSKSRKGAYDTHNYGYKLLAEREGSVELETFLHKYYKDYQISTEWFIYNQEIVDNFLTIEIQEDTISKEDIIFIVRKNIINSISTSDELYKKYSNSIIDELKSTYNYSYKDILEFDEDLYRRGMKDIFECFYRFLVNYWESHDYYNDDLIKELNSNVSISEYENWKNKAELYYRTLSDDNELTKESFNKKVEKKKQKTNDLLEAFNAAPGSTKHSLAEAYRYIAKTANYKDNYVAVNEHNGVLLVPVVNELVIIAEKRAYDIQQVDYKDRFSVFNTILKEELVFAELTSIVKKFLTRFNDLRDFPAKMKFLCTYPLTDKERTVVLDQIPLTYKNYYETLGPERCRANGYIKTDIEREYSDLQFDKNVLASEIRNTFNPGDRYTKSDIKETLKKIYTDLGYNKTPKANDLEQYFEIRDCRITDKETGKKDHGFEILSIRYQEKVDLDD